MSSRLIATWCVCMLFASATVSPASASQSDAVPHRVPVDIFSSDPRGAYRTGTIELHWIDEQRAETTTSDPADKRHLMVQIWYPAAFEGDPPRAPYVLNPELYANPWWMERVEHVRTTSVADAAVADGGRFPVLVYNPGAGWPGFSGTSQAEFLASHGYVVVAVGHTDMTGIKRFPDGYVYNADVQLEPKAAAAQSLSRADRLRLDVQNKAKYVMPVHLQDIRFVLDRLESLDAAPGSKFHRRLDLERVGALGWSMGGALSVQASRDEPRVKAAVNLDGFLYSSVQDTGTRRPILQIRKDEHLRFLSADRAADRERILVGNSLYWQLYARTEPHAPWYDVSLKRTDHGHFSDVALFDKPKPDQMHPRRAHEIVNRFTLQFFDKHLRQAGSAPLLSGEDGYMDTDFASGPKE